MNTKMKVINKIKRRWVTAEVYKKCPICKKHYLNLPWHVMVSHEEKETLRRKTSSRTIRR